MDHRFLCLSTLLTDWRVHETHLVEVSPELDVPRDESEKKGGMRARQFGSVAEEVFLPDSRPSETDAKVAELSIQFDRYKEAQATRWAEAPQSAAAADIELDSNEGSHLNVEQAMMPNFVRCPTPANERPRVSARPEREDTGRGPGEADYRARSEVERDRGVERPNLHQNQLDL
ncbi:hypothetical protein FRC08_017619 [Ceratobasidium sp. 394]|nr:hypothetical protein FRC08_017619 [Ceratobasidium sp. 394]